MRSTKQTFAVMQSGVKVMSKALKCDRCGALYEYDFQLYLRSYYVGKECHPYEDKRLDLCPNCQTELEKWIEERKESKNA